MQVDDKLAKEKLARIADKHCLECLEQGLTQIGLAHQATAIAIRNTDLTDCQPQKAMNEHSSGTRAEVPPSLNDSGAHTPEPWRIIDATGDELAITTDLRMLDDVVPITEVEINWEPDFDAEQRANARRIVACVNACKAIPTEDLERWGVSLIDKIREDEAATGSPMRNLVDRMLGMLEQSGYSLIEHDPDHNNPVKAWMADARTTTGNARESASDAGSDINKEVAAPDQGSVRIATDELLSISGAESVEEALDIFQREREANVGLATENEGLRTLLREWLETELDSQDEEYGPWMEQFTKRVIRALPDQKD